MEGTNRRQVHLDALRGLEATNHVEPDGIVAHLLAGEGKRVDVGQLGELLESFRLGRESLPSPRSPSMGNDDPSMFLQELEQT